MATDYAALAKAAGLLADAQFRNQNFDLTNAEVQDIVNQTGISSQDLTKVIAAVKDATQDNNATAQAIAGINNGISALLAIAKIV